jgi:hypothetical protein
VVRARSHRRYHRVHHRLDRQHARVQRAPCAERPCFGNRVRGHFWGSRLLRLRPGRDVGIDDTRTDRTGGSEPFYHTSADLRVRLHLVLADEGQDVAPKPFRVKHPL